MSDDTAIRFTKVQREVLEALRDGGLITINRMNMAWLGDRAVSPQTRYFLTENRLIERRDKSKAVETQGNGFVLSPKGLAALGSLSTFSQSRRGAVARGSTDSPMRQASEPATERQLAYAKDLGISVPPGATKEEVSDLIDARLNNDKAAAPHYQIIAKRYGVTSTRYTGKKNLFDRLYARLAKPGRELDMTAWFVFRVYRELVDGAPDAPVKDPNDGPIQEIARKLLEEAAVVKSMRRYQGRDLVWFGEWTSPNGTVHEGGSNNTIAYKRASTLLREKGLA